MAARRRQLGQAQAPALVLVAVGIWVAVAVGSVPGLTRPGVGMQTGGMLPAPTPILS